MPIGVRLFLGYALFILAVVGLTLPRVIDLAVNIPISPLGVVWMGLLAYTIFTITLVLQRKEAARSLALGLATLTVPAIPLAFFTLNTAGQSAGPGAIAALACTGLAIALFRGLTGSAARTYLSEP
jgi:hypothetical protein